MIAVVTSTIKPGTQDRSFFSFEERLAQTKHTLTQLQAHGFSDIYIIDNSPALNLESLKELLKEFPTVNAYHILQFQFNNKGINEILMLLYLTDFLPATGKIFKISGRYYPTSSFSEPDFKDFAVRPYQYKSRTGTISTRAYWVKDVSTMKTFLQKCLIEVNAYPERIVGVKSLGKHLGRLLLKKKTTPLNISIEFAAANILKAHNYQITLLENIGIEGLVAGAGQLEKITE